MNAYSLRVHYYQYNDGSSNNGHYSRTIGFDDEVSAREAFQAISLLAERKTTSLGDDQETDSEELHRKYDYIRGSCGGFYTKPPELYKTTNERIA